jgi:hypothetical protein
MPSLGIIVLNPDQESSYYRKIGTRFAEQGVDVYRLKPNAIDPYTEKFTGHVFDPSNQNWEPVTFPIPDLLYDRCFYATRESFKTNYPIVQWLRNRTTFLGHGLPGKWRVHKCLNSDEQLRFYTIETIKVENANTVLQELKRRHSLILKPESGSQGNGIFLLQRNGKNISVKTQRGPKMTQKTFSKPSKLKTWLTKLLRHSPFLMQPFVSLQNKNGQPFDIRILLQKDEKGKWGESGRGIRMGQPGFLTSNLHSGGHVLDYREWLNTLRPAQRIYIEEEIQTITERIPTLLESSFDPLVELGLDIGIDQKGAVWILEANSKPGHQVVLKNNANFIPLPYCDNLLKQKELNRHERSAPSSENSRE